MMLAKYFKQILELLRNHSSLTIIITAAILLELFSAVQYSYTHKLLEDELVQRAESELSSKLIMTRNSLNMVENSLRGHVWDIQRNISHPDSMFSLSEQVLRSHPNMLGCGIAFVPNYFPQKGRLFEPYAYWKDGEIDFFQSGERHDYTQSPFYKTVFEKGVPMWTEPYVDDVTSHKIVTYAKPIFDEQKKIVAVFGADVPLDWMSDTLNHRHIYPSSFDMLQSKSGQLIAGPDKDVPKFKDVERIVELLKDSTVEKPYSITGMSRVFPFESHDGDKGVVFFSSLTRAPQWQASLVCYDDEVYGKLHKMQFYNLLMMLLALFFLGFMVFRFAKNARRLEKIKVEQERINSELKIAKSIQTQMLPDAYPNRSDVAIFGSVVPAKEVGGDVYDFFIRDEKLFFCIGDVSGKGMPSALVMTEVHSLFRSTSTRENNPARMMNVINEAVCQGNKNNMFVTLFIGVLDLPTGCLHYCNAGHDIPLIIGRTVEEMPVDSNVPVGIFDDIKFSLQEYVLAPMTTLFLYTDGLTESFNLQLKQFGMEQVKKELGESTDLGPEEMLEKMGNAVNQFVDGAEQSDDLTMLAVRYQFQPEDSVLSESLTLKNDPRQTTILNTFVQSVADRLGIDTAVAKTIRLAVEEVVVNAMSYAYPKGTEGDITVDVTSAGNNIKFTISDKGIPFDPTEIADIDTTLEVEDRPIGGLGIFLVRELMDSINYERIDGKNVLTIKKELNKELKKL